MPPATLSAMGFDTPFGELNVLATTADATVRAAGFSPLREVVAQLPRELVHADMTDAPVASIAEAVESWLADGGDAITTVPVALMGSPFFVEVWEHLRTVPAGEVVSYQELAQMAGRPRAMRAAGTACARNAVGLFVPCHRVIASGGRLGSYGFGGPGIKAALLAHEGVRVTDAPITEGSRVALVGSDG
ncbi:methylated-DNA--[protein]-cysteine S-methyltransferase [Demequina activiva]|uniref:methylated-DNA--[protein]-cysteine S-methyltransferase n=1 Tax=Demequina activiva TaxID=1582364 RepID=A0A919UFP7_9MICO|nr:methylated-DNA--[protein]-cysteine S-methyltransferase [Demequina activiva]GIG53937.1 putative methylated-DNA:protein-cysteine methyltransferase [Demequina activiva]